MYVYDQLSIFISIYTILIQYMNTSSLSKRFKYTDPKSYEEFITGLKLDLKDVQMKAKTVDDTNNAIQQLF